MISFYVVLLFSRVRIREAMNHLSTFWEGYPEAPLPCPSFSGHFYEQTDSVATGSPLFLVIMNFFTEDSEEVALNWAAHKHLCWFHYVDDSFIIWPHGSSRLKDFYDHLNSVHRNN